MPQATAPAKLILFGEHAVVYGEPAIAVAADRTTTVGATAGKRGHTVNGHRMQARYHSYIKEAVERLWDGDDGIAITTDSDIPSGAGMGSSAALTVATVASLLALKGEKAAEDAVARVAYEAESEAQGGHASPTDTSASTHGHAVLVDNTERDGLLWTIRGGERVWHLHHLDVPALSVVVGDTGEKGKTAVEVAKVARFVKRTGFARDVIREIGEVTREGAEALASGDTARLGSLMTRNHRLLTILGVSTPKLDQLVEAALPTSYGAKLTGSGGGGSIIALTDDADATAEAIRARGGTPQVAKLGAQGVRVL